MNDHPSKSAGALSPSNKRARLKRLLRERALGNRETPLSFGQERLWFLDRMTPGNVAYSETVSGRLIAEVDPRLVTRALNEVVRRHEILRTTFREVDGRPVQRVAAELQLEAPLIDLSGLSEASRKQELQRVIAEQSQRPFDLERGPLLRLTLIHLQGREYFVVLTFHHIVGDGWSVGVFLRELFVAYLVLSGGSAVSLPRPPMQYSDFARWQRGQLEEAKLAAQLAHMKERLANLPVLELPTDRPRPAVQSFRGATLSFELPEDLRSALEAVGREEGATLFMTTLMAFQILLSRYTGEDDIVVGTPVAGRGRAELEGLIGFFVNTVLLRVSLRGDPGIRELLRRVREACLDAYANQDVPFEKLVEELRPERSLSQKPLFQVVFAHHKDLVAAPEIPGVRYEPVRVDPATSKFDLSLYTWKGRRDTGLTASIEYNTDLFDAGTIRRMARQFLGLLRDIAAFPDKRLSDLSLLDEEERRRVLFDANEGGADYPSGCLHHAVERQVERAPDSVAVVFEGQQLSYGELNRRADRLAHRLGRLSVGPEVRVGLYLDRSLDLVVGALGILKAGGAYVPLDPSHPEERIRFMLNDSGARVVVTHSSLAARLGADLEQVRMDEPRTATGAGVDVDPPPAVTAANLAYVMYTSGSTGRPKGVAVTHANVFRLFQAAAARFDFGAGDTWSLFHSCSFDFSVWELWGALLHGGRLVVIPQWVSRSPEEFYERLCRERVTILNQTPSAFGQLQRVEEENRASPRLALRMVIFGGEALEPKTLKPWLDRHGDDHPRLVNMYGITETTVHVTHRPIAVEDIEADAGSVIGRPLSDLRLYLLDRHGNPVPTGVPGEIYVGGAGLARGYLDRPELTAERFIPDPFGPVAGQRLYRSGDRARWLAGGEPQYLGRVDHQVKIRGFRIELGEIESILLEHSAVRQAVVVARSQPAGDTRLVAYLVGGARDLPATAELRRHLGARLPDHMVPSVFEWLEAMPLTPEGKVDRRALPAPSAKATRSVYTAPRNPVELELARIWEEVLNLERVGVEDDFFELGGHSFLAVRVATRIRAKFDLELPLVQLFERPTIARLAEALTSGSPESGEAPGPDLRSEAVLDPSITVIENARQVASPANVFLTGCTGFLGAFLLHELLQRTRANVHCLVRAASVEEGRKRIQEKLGTFSLEKDARSSRIVPVPGDLSRPGLGLPAARFDELASEIDVIYHCGAVVNAIYPYSVHKPANVLGTQEVLRLSSRARVKPVHYVSTTGVVPWNDSSSRVIPEDLELDANRLPSDGYSQSKWVAERLAVEALSRGLPVCIYRPGRISGHSRTGVSNRNDLFSRLLKICIQLGQAPRLDTSALTDIVPVDYVSQALVHLSGREDSIGKVFHLVHPRPVEWRELNTLIADLGYPLEQIPYPVWVANWTRHIGDSEDLALAGLDFSSVAMPESHWLQLPRFDSRNTLEGLEGTPIACAPIDAKLLATYFSYWIRSGYLRPPSGIGSRDLR